MIIAEHPSIEVTEGTEFNLMCQLTSSIRGNFSCSFKKTNTADQCSYDKNNQRCSTSLSGRVEFIGDIQKGICNFRVSSAEPTDNGFWSCWGNNQDTKKWTDVRIISSTDNNTYSVTEGSNITLECPGNQKGSYCVFLHEKERCCGHSYDNDFKGCNCENPNLNIHFVEQKCQVEIKNINKNQ